MRPGDLPPPPMASYDVKGAEPGSFVPAKGVQSAQLVLRHVLRRGQMRFLAPTMLSSRIRQTFEDEVVFLIDFAVENYSVRRWIAGSIEVWQDYTEYLDKAVDFFKSRMFLPLSHEEPIQSVTAYMCDYAPELIEDLKRVNQLVTLARIVLAKSLTGQQFVFQCGTDLALLRLLETCLRVSARSNDSDPVNGGLEKACGDIVACCKQLLVSIMWLLNVFIGNNSGRMLNLWIDLFAREKGEHLGTSAFHEDRAWGLGCRRGFAYHIKDLGGDSLPPTLPLPLPYEVNRLIVALKIAQKMDLNFSAPDFNERFKEIEDIAAPINAEVERLQNEYNETNNQDFAKYLNFTPSQTPPFAKGFPQGITDILKANIARCPWNPEPLTVELRQRTLRDAKRFLIEDLHMNVPELDDNADQDDDTQEYVDTAESLAEPPTYREARPTEPLPNTQVLPAPVLVAGAAEDAAGAIERNNVANAATGSSGAAQEDAFRQRVIADLNAFTLEEEERERLEDDDDTENEDELDDEEDDSEVDEDDLEDDERDPYGEAFKSRGIVSELPLVLGPNEIQALPLILKAGVWLEKGRAGASPVERILKACQCHLLVMHDTGRHLLREMLIFIAAWDLNDEESVYKAMVKVMESVLDHGLMPIAWHSFRETKDVVSPAQSVLVKTLTHIFRLRRKSDSIRQSSRLQTSLDALPDELTFERAIIETLLDDFRSTVVPQTVALIWLQGQIRKNVCLADDFPLNLWDMERVYEGVYQFLELFAVLTETQCWKEMLIRHQLSFELISLLRELEESIDKGRENEAISGPVGDSDPIISPTSPQPEPAGPTNHDLRHGLGGTPGAPGAAPVSVERPYDPSSGSVVVEDDMHAAPPMSMADPLSPGAETIEDAQEASEFEWRNLKKLVVLVLSSLAYKSTLVKTQVRQLGGVELVMKCFEYDRNNPYLKEHAVLCLNFLLEKSPESHAAAAETEAGPEPADT